MEPTKDDLNSPVFNIIWEAIKRWDISRERVDGKRMYSGATGTDVMSILHPLREKFLFSEIKPDKI